MGGQVGAVFEESAVRLAPVSANLAEHMIREVRAGRLLDSSPGHAPMDHAAVVTALTQLSDLMERRHDIAQLVIDPAIVGQHGITATGAHIELGGD